MLVVIKLDSFVTSVFWIFFRSKQIFRPRPRQISTFWLSQNFNHFISTFSYTFMLITTNLSFFTIFNYTNKYFANSIKVILSIKINNLTILLKF